MTQTGDYYACARMCGAPVPPPYVVSRGIGAEGLGCFMCGLFGTGNGTTSYAENVSCLTIRRGGGLGHRPCACGCLVHVLGAYVCGVLCIV